LILVAVMAFLLAVESHSDNLQWTGAKVIGQERQGLVFYTYKGQTNTVDVQGYGSKARYAVMVNRNEPADAEPYSVGTRISDGLFVLGPLVAGAAVVSVGAFRRRRQRVRAGQSDGFGSGLDDDFVQRQLKQLRGE
jgi:hypothetical protein